MNPVSATTETPDNGTGKRLRRLALAYEELFGQSGRRGASAKLVMDHLTIICGQDRPIFEVDKVGAFDPLRAAHIDGARTILLNIERQLKRARESGEEKPKPNVKKGK